MMETARVESEPNTSAHEVVVVVGVTTHHLENASTHRRGTAVEVVTETATATAIVIVMVIVTSTVVVTKTETETEIATAIVMRMVQRPDRHHSISQP